MDSLTQLSGLAIPDPNVAAKLTRTSAVRYIKLGKGGAWSANAIARGIIPFGFREIAHVPCAAGDWTTVREQLAAAGRTNSGITQGLRELRDFYEQGEECLWVTFADGHLWWAFAEDGVRPIGEGDTGGPRRFRRTLDGWHRHNMMGELLSVRSLSSALTRVAGYRMTICTIEREDYLLRRIRGEEEPLLTEARKLRSDLEAVTVRMIGQLDWRDFEIMVELIFSRGGWQRQSALGTGEIDIDLLLDLPTTNETAWVQVKSSATQATLDDYLDCFRRDGSSDRFYFVCHTPKGTLSLPEERALQVWTGTILARNALAAGLLDWLIERTR
ncbi:hypothetical protein [Rhizorhapis sp.]|uniref:hypothetical protein n=1 Tax=Rhizorhapis sp. TaxID=1968842 RepID=UPI002B478FC3|nr:hypothetical protein [Rhizorhapis sp.]HKR15844.1 hypothetical protein [Rhizorhapis sp.]